MVIFKAGFKTDKGQGTRLGSKIIRVTKVVADHGFEFSG